MANLDFGETFSSGKLMDKNGEYDLKPENYDAIGLYFSAHWCPPCRGFTPVLSKLYDTKSDDDDGKKLQIVFVSSDRDKGSFDSYFGTMPWVALKFEERETKEKLAKKYEIRGIPTLVILDKDGNLVTKEGRGGVSDDTKAGDFVKWCRGQKKA